MDYTKLIQLYKEKTGSFPDLEDFKSFLEINAVSQIIKLVNSKESQRKEIQRIMDTNSAYTEADLGREIIPLEIKKDWSPEKDITNYLLKCVNKYTQNKTKKEKKKPLLGKEIQDFVNIIKKNELNKENSLKYFKQQTGYDLEDEKTRRKFSKLLKKVHPETMRTRNAIKNYSEKIKDFNGWLNSQLENVIGTEIPINEKEIALRLQGKENILSKMKNYSEMLENSTNYQLFNFYLATKKIREQQKAKKRNKDSLVAGILIGTQLITGLVKVTGIIDFFMDILHTPKIEKIVNRDHYYVKESKYCIGPNVIEWEMKKDGQNFNFTYKKIDGITREVKYAIISEDVSVPQEIYIRKKGKPLKKISEILEEEKVKTPYGFIAPSKTKWKYDQDFKKADDIFRKYKDKTYKKIHKHRLKKLGL